MNKYRFAGVLLIALSIFLNSCTSQKIDSNKISIGIILPLTGPAAPYGESGKNGIDLAFKHFSNTNPEFAKQINLIYEDDKADPKTGVTVLDKLTDINRVTAIIGPMVSGVALSLVNKINNKQLLVVTPTATSPKLRGASKFLYRTCVSDDVEGSQMAEAIINKFHIKKIGILFISNEYGLGLKQVFEKTYKDLEGQILLAEAYSPETSDFRNTIQKIKHSNIEAIYLVGQKEQKVLIKQLKEASVKARIFGTTMIEDPDILATNAAEGVIYTYRALSDPNVIASVQPFFSDYKSLYGKEPDYYAAANYDAATVVFHAVLKANQTKKLPYQTIKDLKLSQGVTGPLTFDKKNDVIQQFVLKIIRDNKFTFYKDGKQYNE